MTCTREVRCACSCARENLYFMIFRLQNEEYTFRHSSMKWHFLSCALQCILIRASFFERNSIFFLTIETRTEWNLMNYVLIISTFLRRKTFLKF